MADSEQDPVEGRFRNSISTSKDVITAAVGATGAVVIATLIVACVVGVPLAMMIIGAQNLHACPVEDKVPIYMIVAGASALLVVPYSLMVGSCTKSKVSEKSTLQTCITVFNGFLMTLISLFCFAWFVCGSIWVFRNYRPNLDDKSSSKYCDKTTYLFSFSILIITYICAFFSCCCSFCFKRRSQDADLP